MLKEISLYTTDSIQVITKRKISKTHITTMEMKFNNIMKKTFPDKSPDHAPRIVF